MLDEWGSYGGYMVVVATSHLKIQEVPWEYLVSERKPLCWLYCHFDPFGFAQGKFREKSLNLHEISQSLHSFEMTADVVCEGFRSDTT